MQKTAYLIGKSDFPKRKTKTMQWFKTEAIVHRKLSLEKSEKSLVEKSLAEKKRHSVPSSSTVFVGVKIVRQYIYFFSSFD